MSLQENVFHLGAIQHKGHSCGRELEAGMLGSFFKVSCGNQYEILPAQMSNQEVCIQEHGFRHTVRIRS
jgi:hypothetical protein